MKCPYCDRQPKDIGEYVSGAAEYGVSPDTYVLLHEGTYDSKTDLFCCTSCYIKIGMPLKDRLHGAFEVYREQVEPLEVIE